MRGKKVYDLLVLANGLALAVLVNLLVSNHFFRIDLTEEKRFTVKEPTRKLLQSLEDEVYMEVYLEGELNAPFRRMRKAVIELLEEFRIYSDNRVRYTLVNPNAAMGEKARNEYIRSLMEKGIVPTRVVERTTHGTSEKLIFPAVLVSYGGAETAVNMLKGSSAGSRDEKINQSIEGLEYELANAIYKLANTEKKRVGVVVGIGEPDSLRWASLNNALLERYEVYKVNLRKKNKIPGYDALILIKPTTAVSEADKFKIDQYVMSGGRLLVLLDKLDAVMDSASRENYFAFPYAVNLDDLLFKYGVRVNNDLVQDRMAALYPVVTGTSGARPEMQLMEWPFFPLINHMADHPVTRNLDAVVLRFASSVDTVKAPGVRKTALMFTSAFSRKVGAPVRISINDLRKTKPVEYNQRQVPVAWLLEGTFTSLYKNRFLPEGVKADNYLTEGKPAKVLVIGDGDIALNEINPRTGNPVQLGYDPFTQYTFANEELLMNAMAWLTDENGLITTKNKTVKIRPLSRTALQQHKLQWQIINVVMPVLLLTLSGWIYTWLRKRKFTT
ncbi:MAG: gliding motility-associated ABC transporter substrate-binding protein GldG [Cyclobacteriaceae bacterium]|nr:gliding motility-associated ABC transporter substrate-binding protein GldG [Cyclobacteriaceae bacterium]